MGLYLALIAAIVIANSLPAFAPPTWSILLFFLFNYHLNPFLLVALGVISATIGRGFLAWYFRRFAPLAPDRFAKNINFAGNYISKSNRGRYAIVGIFIISPLSSAQLFEAVGLMKSMRLIPLLGAFALGRTISYSIYVSGASAVAASNFGEVILQELKSPWAIAVQIAMIIGVVLLGAVNWQTKLHKE